MNSFLFNLVGIGWRVSAFVVLVALLRPWLRRGIGSHGVALLWSVLAVRLLWPGLPESRWGLIHAAASGPAVEVTRIIPQPGVENHGSQRRVLLETPRPARSENAVFRSASAPRAKVTLLGWIAGGWATGCCAVAAYFLWHLLAARRWSARTLPAADYPRLADAFAALPARIRGNLEVRVTRELDTPVLVGWLRPQIWVPASWVDRLGREELQHVLWHEAGHARRRDLPVQWLFAVACCVHWFNPLVWLLARWARDERELACDAWVCAQQGEPEEFTTEYGRTLLRLVTGVRPSRLWPLAPATVAMAASVGHLRQRLREIAAFRPVPAWRGSTGALAGALALAALTTVGTVSHAQETPAPTAAPVAAPAGTITGRVVSETTGKPLANALVRAAVGKDADMRMNRHPDSGCIETRTDGKGEYRLSVPLSAGEQSIQLDALAPGYRSSAGTYASGGDRASVTPAPGGTGKYDFKLPEALYLKGIVVDEAGQPVRNVEIETTNWTENAFAYVTETRTAADGQFEVFDFPLSLGEGWKAGRLTARHDDYIPVGIDNVYSLGKEEQTHLKLVLAKGKQITGTLLDASGKPAAAVDVTARTPGGKWWPKTSVTDREGKFALRGLIADTDYLVTAHALTLKQKYQAKMRTDADHDGLTLHLTPVVLNQSLKPVEVMGMQLVDLTDELRAVYDYDSKTKGALILDPGKNSGRLQIGEIKEGQVFWLVEDVDEKQTVRVAGVRELVDALVKDLRRNDDGTSTCRVVYTEDPWSTNTQHLHVTEQEAADLKALAAKLDAEQPAASPAAAATPASAAAAKEHVAYRGPIGYAFQVDGKTMATLLLPHAGNQSLRSSVEGIPFRTKLAPPPHTGEATFKSSGGAVQDTKAPTLTLAYMGDVTATFECYPGTPVTVAFTDMTVAQQPAEAVEHPTLVLPWRDAPSPKRAGQVGPDAPAFIADSLIKRTNPTTGKDAWFFTGDASIAVPHHAPIVVSGESIEVR